MANARRGIHQFIDSVGELTTNGKDRAAYVVLTATAANAVLVLSDSDDQTLMDLREPVSGETKVIDFSLIPSVFSKGLKAKTVTNCVATIIFTNSTGGVGST